MSTKKYNKHSTQVKPFENKFHTGNDQDKKHYWLTPLDVYEK